MRELESELADIRGLAMLLGKTAELQGAQALPPSDHAVWGTPGALGGVQHTLDVVLRHLKVRAVRAAVGPTLLGLAGTCVALMDAGSRTCSLVCTTATHSRLCLSCRTKPKPQAQESRVKGATSQVELLEDRLRAECNEKAALAQVGARANPTIACL